MIKLEKLDTLSPEEIESLTPEDIAALMELFNDLTNSMNLVLESFRDMAVLIHETFKGFYIDDKEN